MRILKKTVLFTLVLLAVGSCVAAQGCGIDESAEVESDTRDIFAMDTFMTLTAYGPNATAALDEAEDTIKDIESKVSATITDSEISMLNEKKTEKVSDEVFELIKKSKEINESTGGLFDISIYPVMKAWGFTTENYRVPSESELDDLLPFVDSSKIELDETSDTVTIPDTMEVELGGITKGYTSSKIAEIFEKNGVTSGLINLGGNVQTIGTKVDGSKWNIGVEDPDDENGYLCAISVADKAVVTSGGYERYFEEDGVRYHHIIDPRTGYPSDSGLSSVSIISSDGTLADGLSTSLFIMGYDDAVSYWKAHSDLFDMVLVDDDGMIYVSKGLEEDFSTDREYKIIE